MATTGTIAARLRIAGHTIQEITQLVYGHPGTQAFYTLKRGCLSTAPKGLKGRLRKAGYNTEDIQTITK